MQSTGRSRSKRLLLTMALLPSLLVRPADAQIDRIEPDAAAARFAFGSCIRHEKAQHVWDAVRATRPDVWIWLGDNIYADIPRPGTGSAELDSKVVLGRMPAMYEAMDSIDGYARLKAACRVLGTWDDHDYGINDAGAEFPGKARSQQLFLDFLGEPESSDRRATPGVYASSSFGPEGRRVQVILLDTRYFRSPLVKGDNPRENWSAGYPGSYAPSTDPEATILGAEQWRWLATVLSRPAELRIIASSIQVIANDHRFEKWGNFPAERRRLMQLIRDSGAGGVLFISGDRHAGEISRFDPRRGEPGSFVDVGYPLYDVTSSALTNSAPTAPGEDENSSRAGFVQYSNERNRHRIGSHIRYNNFGTIEIDWQGARGPAVTMRLHTDRGRELIRETVVLQDLRPSKR